MSVQFRRLSREALVDDPYRNRRAPRVWTRERLSKLEGLIDQGMTDAQIAARLETTEMAVTLARRRKLALPAGTSTIWTAGRVARLFGVDTKTVALWMRNGWLKVRRNDKYGRRIVWVTTEDDLTVFVENPAYWHVWEPARMTDAAWREWATEVHSERYLTTDEVAMRLCVVPATVVLWIRNGELPAAKHGAHWRVAASALEDFVIPSDRSRAGRPRRPYSKIEERAIPILRAAGMSWDDIGTLLGRQRNHVAAHWRAEGAA